MLDFETLVNAKLPEVELGGDLFRLTIPPYSFWEQFQACFKDTNLIDKADETMTFVTLLDEKDSPSDVGYPLYTSKNERILRDAQWMYYRPILIPMMRDGKTIDYTFGYYNPDGSTLSGGYLQVPHMANIDNCCLGHTDHFRSGPSIDLNVNGIPSFVMEIDPPSEMYLGCHGELEWVAFRGVLFCMDGITMMRVGEMIDASLVSHGIIGV